MQAPSEPSHSSPPRPGDSVLLRGGIALGNVLERGGWDAGAFGALTTSLPGSVQVRFPGRLSAAAADAAGVGLSLARGREGSGGRKGAFRLWGGGGVTDLADAADMGASLVEKGGDTERGMALPLPPSGCRVVRCLGDEAKDGGQLGRRGDDTKNAPPPSPSPPPAISRSVAHTGGDTQTPPILSRSALLSLVSSRCCRADSSCLRSSSAIRSSAYLSPLGPLGWGLRGTTGCVCVWGDCCCVSRGVGVGMGCGGIVGGGGRS
mmetsp:Transcript_28284/g.81497  ORF Transcript_28284/g.81497 Transcript_28284/m.81497 type:complete len:263 (-) Transcript_28284:372-1160(-)